MPLVGKRGKLTAGFVRLVLITFSRDSCNCINDLVFSSGYSTVLSEIRRESYTVYDIKPEN